MSETAQLYHDMLWTAKGNIQYSAQYIIRETTASKGYGTLFTMPV